MPLEPCRLFLQSALAEPAGPHAPDLLRGHEPGPLQYADVLLHAGEGHAEVLGKLRDRSVGTSELLQNAASRGIRKRGERGVEASSHILNHAVQYCIRTGRTQGETRSLFGEDDDCSGWVRRRPTMRCS